MLIAVLGTRSPVCVPASSFRPLYGKMAKPTKLTMKLSIVKVREAICNPIAMVFIFNGTHTRSAYEGWISQTIQIPGFIVKKINLQASWVL